MSTSDDELSRDAFLGGRLHLWQPRQGYRAGIDPILLAASVPARPGQSVLDLGCGVGAALFALCRRVGAIDATGLELQPFYADLARRNAAANGLPAAIHVGDATAPPPELRARRYHHVFSNPPYFAAGDGTAAADAGRETALRERASLDDWIAQGTRRLLPKGTMSVIQRTDRLPDLLAAMAPRLGGLRIRPLQPRRGAPAHLVIVHGIKEARGPCTMDEPILLHVEKSSRNVADNYTRRVTNVLREANFIDDISKDSRDPTDL